VSVATLVKAYEERADKSGPFVDWYAKTKKTATHCNTLQHITTHCTTL